MHYLPKHPELRTAAPLASTYYPVLGAAALRWQREQWLRTEMARRATFLNQLGRHLAAVYGAVYVEPSLRHPSIGQTPHVEVLSEILAMCRRGQIYNLTFALARKRLADAAAEFNLWADREAALVGLSYVRPCLRRHAFRQIA